MNNFRLENAMGMKFAHSLHPNFGFQKQSR